MIRLVDSWLVFLAVTLSFAAANGNECGKDPAYNICNYYVQGGGFCKSSLKTLYLAHNKCYQPFEVPKRDLDAPSDVMVGHNFILADDFDENGVTYGVHVSGLLLPPHMYHGVLKFKISKSEVKTANRDISHLPSGFRYRSIRYNKTPIKLVDLAIFNQNTFEGRIAEATGPLYKDILVTKIKIENVMDFRRYDATRAVPAEEHYLVFGSASKTYVSHIPSTCGDYQELMEIELIGFPATTTIYKHGSIIRINKKAMYLLLTGGDRVGKEVEVTYDGRSLEPDTDIRKIRIKRVVFHDNCIVNLFCSNPKNIYTCT